MSTQLNLQEVRLQIENALEKLTPLFKPGAKLTFIMRNPKVSKECNLVITEDNLGALADLLAEKADAQDPNTIPCCDYEDRSWEGGCKNCGAPCI